MNSQNEMLHIINQARADARGDNFKRFLNRHSKIITKAIVVVLLIAIGFFCYNAFQKSRAEKFSEKLHQSLLDQQAGELDKAKDALKKIYETKSAPNGVRSLASLRYAAFLLEEGKINDATKVYQEINDCKFCDDYVKDLAGLLLVKLWVADASEAQKDDISARIEKIENRASILQGQIAEQRAVLEMHKGNLEKSYEIFESIEKSAEASKAVKMRAVDGMKMLIEKGYTKKSV